MVSRYFQVDVSPSSGVPVFRQLIDQANAMVVSGKLRPGDMLPSTRDVAKALEVEIINSINSLKSGGSSIVRSHQLHENLKSVFDGAAPVASESEHCFLQVVLIWLVKQTVPIPRFS